MYLLWERLHLKLFGDMFISNPEKLPNESGKAAYIHLHNQAEDGNGI